MERRIFLRLRHRVKAHTGDIITIGDAAQIAGQQKLKKKLSALPLYKVTKKDKNIVVLDIIKVLKTIHTAFPALDVQTVGGAETIVEIHYQKSSCQPFYSSVSGSCFLSVHVLPL